MKRIIAIVLLLSVFLSLCSCGTQYATETTKIDKKNTGDMLSIALDKQTHRNFTNLWRQVIPYGTNYKDLKPSEIWDAAQKVYAGYPKLLEAARKTIFN